MNFRFDFNESFTFIASIILMAGFWRMRKHFHPLVILMIWVYNVAFVATLDYALASTPFDWYYCLDNETYEYMGALSHIFMYTPFSFYFLYFYDKWAIHGKKLVFYLIGWTCLSIFFEWVCLQAGFLTHMKWKLWYSIPTYPVAALILIRVYRFIEARLPNKRNDPSYTPGNGTNRQ